jgi:hypothetical protein
MNNLLSADGNSGTLPLCADVERVGEREAWELQVGSIRRAVGRRLRARAILKVPCDAAGSAMSVGARPQDDEYLAHMKPVKSGRDTRCNAEHLIECGAVQAVRVARRSERDGEGVVGGCLLGRLLGHSGECAVGGSDRCRAAYSWREGKTAAASLGSQKEIHAPCFRSAEKEGRIDE